MNVILRQRTVGCANVAQTVALPLSPLAIVVLVAVGGCGSSTSECPHGDPTPSIRIQSPIADATTNAGQGPFPVSFHSAGSALDPGRTADLMARLALQTWPEGAPIEVTTALDPTSDTQTATAEVTAATPLDDRWYALVYGAPGCGLYTPQTFDDGVWGIRLRPTSHPFVRLIELCGGADTAGMKLIVTFSEPVTLSDLTGTLTVRQDDVVVNCQVDSSQAASINELCGALIPGPVTITLADGVVQGPDGASLMSQTWSVDIRNLPILESGCNGYRVPLPL